jgi:hypothetical protein
MIVMANPLGGAKRIPPIAIRPAVMGYKPASPRQTQ